MAPPAAPHPETMNQAAARGKQDCDGPWELPEGWCWTTIGGIANLRGEKVNPQSEPNLPFVGMDDIEAHGTRIVQTRPFGAMKSAGNRFHKNDVLYGRLRPYLNKTALAPEGGACSGELLAITPSSAVSPKYLQLFMHARRFVNTAMSTVSGDRPRIDFATIAAFDFPLAPLAEQRRIVARVDALFAEIASGEAALEAARKELDAFRRALLKAAVTGELTKDWRENNPVTETGHDLLARIKADRAARGQAKGPEKQGQKRSSDAPPLDASALPQLPKGWAWGTVAEILLGIEAGLNVSAEGRPPEKGETGIVKVSAVTWGEFDENASKALPTSAVIDTRDLIAVGDFLFSRANTLELVGAPVIVKSISKRLVLSDKILRFRLVPGAESWLEVVLKSAFGRQQIESRATGAQLSMRNISQDSIRAIPIPIPPPLEAAEILRRVAQALAASADTLKHLDAEAADAARLKQSILKAAFEGRLAPQDPADEPASAMLARLRATQSTAGPAKRGRKKRDP